MLRALSSIFWWEPRFSGGVEWSGSRTQFSNARRGKLESVVDTVLLVDAVVAEDLDLALERDELVGIAMTSTWGHFFFVLLFFRIFLGFPSSGERVLGVFRRWS